MQTDLNRVELIDGTIFYCTDKFLEEVNNQILQEIRSGKIQERIDKIKKS